MNRRYLTRRAFLFSCLLAALACAAMLSPKGSGQVKGTGFDQEVGRALNRYDRLTLDPADTERRVRQTGRLTLATPAGTFELLLAPHDMRAEGYRAVAVLEGGVTRELPRGPSRTFKGTVEGSAGSQARFTLDAGTVEGMIIAGGQKFFVEPAARYTREAEPGDFLFYRDSDVVPGGPYVCGVETLSAKVDAQVSRTQAVGAAESAPAVPVSPRRRADMATEADFEFTSAFGSAGAANNEILSIMNQVDGVYQAEIGLTFRVIFQRAWNTPNDPYNASTLPGLLDEVRNVFSPPAPAPGVPPPPPPAGSETRDLVHMWTGRDLDGLQTGLAYSEVTTSTSGTTRGVVCRFQQFAVGVSERQANAFARAVIPAHEIGHNFSANHPEAVGHGECASTIMFGTAQDTTAFTFCQFSRDEITNYVNANNSCMEAVAAAATPSVQFSTTSYVANEGTPSVQIVVTRSTGEGASTVQYQTTNGTGTNTASERSDYTTAVGTLRFNAGETSKSFSVLITNDAYGEGPETFQVSLANPSNATLGTPSSANVTVNSDETANGANPVRPQTFNAEFFVRQHYADFLNREPDASGLAHWINQTTNCGNPNLEVCRVNVSGAFFLSIEFQETGFYAIRVQRVAFNRRSDNPQTRMTYREVIRDQRQIGEGLVVNQPGFEQVLENNKNAYAVQVVSGADFAGRFPQATGDAFVDALYGSAGVAPTSTERQNAINAYNTNAAQFGALIGRAAALRAVADSNSIRNAELNTAFVLLQYHGYLRRNPTDAPDTSDAGYQSWLTKLNQFNGNYVQAEMVTAFLRADEYILRFGP